MPVDGRLVEEDAGEVVAEVCNVYADNDDVLPNKLEATASMIPLSILYPEYSRDALTVSLEVRRTQTTMDVDQRRSLRSPPK